MTDVPQTSTLNAPPYRWFTALLGALVVLTVFIWVLTRRRPRPRPHAPALLPASVEGNGVAPPSYTVVVAPRSVTGSVAEASVTPSPPQPVVHIEAPGTTHTHSAAWQQRALAAEREAQRATAIIHHGLIPHLREWLKHKLLRRLIADRTKLMEVQQTAAFKALAVEERLGRVELQIRQQNLVYERRVEELTRELLAAKEENRELIREKIAQVKAEMEAARARVLAEAGAEEPRADIG